MRIAIDAMGGDNAPQAVLEGVLAASSRVPGEILVVGPSDYLRRECASLIGSLPEHVRFVEASQVIQADESPLAALRRKRDSSLAVGLRLVKEGEADAFVSAGSTGALMAGGLLTFGRIPGVDRPAIPGVVPTADGHGVLLLDLGANLDASPANLLQYATMGAIYAEKVLGWPEPTVALLNVGTEPNKGTEAHKQAYCLLERSPLRFAGNVEAREMFSGAVDVVVCDGFVGNVVLKALEGMALELFGLLRRELTQGLRAKAGAALLAPALRRIAARLDYGEYGGAPLLGIDGICVKTHGSSQARSFAQALHTAQQAVQEGLLQRLRDNLQGVGDAIG